MVVLSGHADSDLWAPGTSWLMQVCEMMSVYIDPRFIMVNNRRVNKSDLFIGK